jgi:hypothetical protein
VKHALHVIVLLELIDQLERFGGLRLQSSTGLVQHRFSSLFDASAALSLFGDGLADLGVYREASQVQMLAQDIFISGEGAGRFD